MIGNINSNNFFEFRDETDLKNALVSWNEGHNCNTFIILYGKKIKGAFCKEIWVLTPNLTECEKYNMIGLVLTNEQSLQVELNEEVDVKTLPVEYDHKLVFRHQPRPMAWDL